MNYGLIGEKLGHSYSKFIQERLLDNYTYEIHPIPKEKLDAFMKKKDFKGINVTIPYKEKVLPYLDFIDEKAKRIGAVNTIVNKNNKLYGYNTDYYGFDYMIKVHNINLKDKTILILGAGGASKAIQEVCKDHNCKELIMTATRQRDNIVTIDEVYKRSDDIDIIINTTPCGMYPNIYTKACDVSKFKNCKAVIDVVYNPINTELCL
ncbi:MAG: shikimate dehydrogenase, partial [Holdemanella sp.]|nr:shikimate dehydrogenase [Holdemanella sp.]